MDVHFLACATVGMIANTGVLRIFLHASVIAVRVWWRKKYPVQEVLRIVVSRRRQVFRQGVHC